MPLVYMPGARPISADPLSPEGRAASEYGLLVVCLMDNMPCRQIGEALANNGARTATVVLTGSFWDLLVRP